MIVREGYMSGGAGYVLSRGEITVFNNVVTISFPRQSPCEGWPPRLSPTPASARWAVTRERRMWRWGSVSRTWACSAQTAGTTWASSGGRGHWKTDVLQHIFCSGSTRFLPRTTSTSGSGTTQASGTGITSNIPRCRLKIC